jgi:predicted RNase H-like HicB family nuclease
MKLSITLMQIENEYIASCPELEINCYGSDKGDAIRRIKNVLQFYIASAQELGFEVESLDSMVIEGGNTLPFRDHAIVETPGSVH